MTLRLSACHFIFHFSHPVRLQVDPEVEFSTANAHYVFEDVLNIKFKEDQTVLDYVDISTILVKCARVLLDPAYHDNSYVKQKIGEIVRFCENALNAGCTHIYGA